MLWYRRGKLSLDGFGSLASRVAPIDSIFNPSLRICQSGYLSSCTKGATFSGFSSISQRLGKRGGVIEVNKSFLHNVAGARRFYYLDHNNVKHFKPRGTKNLIQRHRYVFIVLMVGCGVLIKTLYLDKLEIVPYSMRPHLILMSKASERRLGERGFQQMVKACKTKILPPTHPELVRVRKVSKDIIGALERGLRKEKVWSDVGYESDQEHHSMMVVEENERERKRGRLSGLDENEGMVVELEGIKWNKEDEIIDDDDKWVEESRKKGKEKGSKPATSHLIGLNWEVLVVDAPVVNAFCYPGGKIVVFTGLLNFLSDEELAAVIAHEVGHAVARHVAERLTRNLWYPILESILSPYVSRDVVRKMTSFFFRLPFSRWNELEADYIGILLMSSAGYDPRAAPKLFEKFAKLTKDSKLMEYVSTHPSDIKRARLLSRAKTMEEALGIYKDARAGRMVEGFLEGRKCRRCYYDENNSFFVSRLLIMVVKITKLVNLLV